MELSTIVDESASRFPDRVALSMGERQVTFGQFADLIARLAGGLMDLGLAPGDRVAILLPDGVELGTTILACSRAQLIAVPIFLRFAAPQIGYIVRHCGARALVTTPEIWQQLPASERESLDFVIVTGPATDSATSYQDLLTAAPAALRRSLADPIGLIMYTSGTTSRPKGVAHSSGRMAERVDLFIHEMGLTGEDRTIIAGAMGRPIVLLSQMLPMLRTGGSIEVLPRFDPELFWNAYRRLRPTYMTLGIGLTTELIDHPAAVGCDHSRLRFWVVGGDKAQESLTRRFAEIVDKPLLEMCGMTETGFFAVMPPQGPYKSGSIGPAMRGVAIRIVNGQAREDVVSGETGLLLVRTPTMMIGYWNDTLQTHRVLQNGWIDTGDLVRADDDGYLWFIGREKDMITRGGWKIPPILVEETLTAHPAIREAVVVGIPDAKWGQVPFAFYELRAEATDPTSDELTQWIGERLEKTCIPVSFVRLERWPRTGQGKLDRARLGWMAAAGGVEI